MAYVDWMIRGPKMVSCNCDYGCPCEFLAPPTRDICEGFDAMEIAEGWFGDVRLDGLRIASTYHWPGPVHEGKGVTQGVIDARATEAISGTAARPVPASMSHVNSMSANTGSSSVSNVEP